MDQEKAKIAVIDADASLLGKLESFYGNIQKESDNPYVAFLATDEGFTVTIYKKEKQGRHKVVFQGDEALYEASIWGYVPPENENVALAKTKSLFPQIGSDEVGTGDFFGPICVCAAFVRKEDLPRLKELGVTDSKAMEDEKILEIGKILIKEFDYAQIPLFNEKYNEVRSSGLNMNAIKAKMHNRCLFNLRSKHPESHIYQDLFAESGLYYSYLKGDKDVVRNITFSTKGELHYPSVALASVIARYSFLKKMMSLDEKYGLHFPFGAGEAVDEFAISFVEKYGAEELSKVAKMNFANVKRILGDGLIK